MRSILRALGRFAPPSPDQGLPRPLPPKPPRPPRTLRLLRITLSLVFFLGLSWGLFSCGSDDCIEAVRLRDTNTHSDPCKVDCDCNNLTHEGYCVEGRCVSKKRETAQTKGAVRHCLLFRPRNLCRWGLQTAQPNPLTSLLWGDCRPYGIEPENTQATCTDGKDNNCDGRVDLFDPFCSAFCSPGQERPCFSGPQDRLNQGSCRPGRQTCLTPSSWGPCQGEVLPTAETCNGQDDDCNGSIDDGLPGCTPKPCKDGSQRPCYTHAQGCSLQTSAGSPSFLCVGTCRPGRQICQDGRWGDCFQPSLPQTEICDGLDNNCDGKVDEGCLCQSGTFQVCSLSPLRPSLSPCTDGLQLCQADSFWGACQGATAPAAEVCDGKDNDCNGQIDDNLASPLCPEQRGVCFLSQQRCGGEKGWLPCTEAEYRAASAAYLPSEDKSPCDGLDNNCDGKTDEGCEGCDPRSSAPRACYSGLAKTADIGLCKTGYQLCILGDAKTPSPQGRWGECTSQITPQPEVCDGKDNNCDGQIDETSPSPLCPKGTACIQGSCQAPSETPLPDRPASEASACSSLTRPCYAGPPGTVGVGPCQEGYQLCSLDNQGAEVWGACLSSVTPQTERCNGKDDDCNGQIDDQASCPSGGVCSSGRCQATDSRPPEVLPDAVSPEGLRRCSSSQRPCYTGPAQTQGVGRCFPGLQFCTLDPQGVEQWGACVGQITPQTEVCDGQDDDCDGQIDNAALCPSGERCSQGRCSSLSPDQSTESPATSDETCTPGQTRPCYDGPASSEGVGLCKAGVQICSTSTRRFDPCSGAILPATEVCDGLDNDCNGSIDDIPLALRRPCPKTSGVCFGTLARCVNGQWEAGCTAAQYQAHSNDFHEQSDGLETSRCDGLDNDCDGSIDEGCPWSGLLADRSVPGSGETAALGLDRQTQDLWLGGATFNGQRWNFLNDPLEASSFVKTSPTTFLPKPFLLRLQKNGQEGCYLEATPSYTFGGTNNGMTHLQGLSSGVLGGGLFAAGGIAWGSHALSRSTSYAFSPDIFLFRADGSCQPSWATRIGSPTTALADAGSRTIRSLSAPPSGGSLCLTGSSGAKNLLFGVPPTTRSLALTQSQGDFLACLDASTGGFTTLQDLSSSRFSRLHFATEQTLHLAGSVCSTPQVLGSLPAIAPGANLFVASFSFDAASHTALASASLALTHDAMSSCDGTTIHALASFALPSGKQQIVVLASSYGGFVERTAGALGGQVLAAPFEGSQDLFLLSWEFEPTGKTYRFLWSRRFFSAGLTAEPLPSKITEGFELTASAQGIILSGLFQGFLASGNSIVSSLCLPSFAQSLGCVASSADSHPFVFKLDTQGRLLSGFSGTSSTNGPASGLLRGLAADPTQAFLYLLTQGSVGSYRHHRTATGLGGQALMQIKP